MLVFNYLDTKFPTISQTLPRSIYGSVYPDQNIPLIYGISLINFRNNGLGRNRIDRGGFAALDTLYNFTIDVQANKLFEIEFRGFNYGNERLFLYTYRANDKVVIVTFFCTLNTCETGRLSVIPTKRESN